MTYNFAIPYGLSDDLRAAGLTQYGTRDSIRAGRIADVALPTGSVQLDRISDGVEGGAYSIRPVYRYRLPDGTIIRAGGGGPSDADSITVVVQ